MAKRKGNEGHAAKSETANRKPPKGGSGTAPPKPAAMEPNSVDAAVDPNFVVCLAEYIGGGGPVTGHWSVFKEWMTEQGYSEAEIEQQMNAIYRAAGRVR